jgi:hypothetical protein
MVIGFFISLSDTLIFVTSALVYTASALLSREQLKPLIAKDQNRPGL